MIVVSVSRRPLAGSVAANVLQHGTGAVDVDGCRVSTSDDLNGGAYSAGASERHDGAESWRYKRGEHGNAGEFQQPNGGRWPANLLLGHPPGCVRLGAKRVESTSGVMLDHHRRNVPLGGQGIYGHGDLRGAKPTCYVSPDGTEVVEAWDCADGCPVAELDGQTGVQRSGTAGARSAQNGYDGGWGATSHPWGSYGDVGGASRYFKQVGGQMVENTQVPEDLLSYLYTMITPTHAGGESLVAMDLDAVDWASIPDGKYHGVLARGEPTAEQVEQMWRVVRPGAHVLLIAPDSCPTGHRGACALEDRGFEIRDAILWVREPGKLHYVPKANTKERNLGTEKLAAKRKGPPTYELTEEALADEEAIGELQEALVEAGLTEDVVEGIVENGLPKDQVPKEHKHLFQKREGSGKYGNNHPCLHPDALVMTDRGYCPVSDIVNEDRVLAADGTFHTVEHVSFHAYTSPNLYEVAVQGTNYTTLATDNHPFLIWRPTRSKKGSLSGGKVLWLRADEVRKGDYTMTPHLKEGGALPAHLPAKRCAQPDFWFVFGLYLAEGVLQRAGHGLRTYPSFTLHEDETHLVERIRLVCEKVGVYPKKGSKAVQVVAFDAEAGDWFGLLGGHGASTKGLDPAIWALPKEHQRAILDGYLAGDGGRVRDYWQAKTVSPDLASQLAVLAEGLGYKVNLFRFEGGEKVILGRTVNALPHYQLQLYEKNRAEGRVRKPSRPTTVEHEGTTYTLRHVKAVTEVPYEGDVWNLSVEGSPTFQTAVGMSHNTVKPREVMQRLLHDVPEGSVVMDPFMGSGSTAIACLEEGYDFVGIEREKDYIEIADARVRYWKQAKLRSQVVEVESEAPEAAPVVLEQNGPLFDLFEE